MGGGVWKATHQVSISITAFGLVVVACQTLLEQRPFINEGMWLGEIKQPAEGRTAVK